MLERFASKELLLSALLSQRAVRGDKSLADQLAERVKLVEYDACETIIGQGGDDNDIFFILAGRVEIEVNGRRIASRGPNEHVGEMAAILPSLRRSASVISVEKCVLGKLNAIELIALADRYPIMWRQFASVLAERLLQRNSLVTQTHDKIRVFIISSVEAVAVARAIQESFAHDRFQVTIWTDGIFRASQYAVESLLNVVDISDFAIAIASPDDAVQSRGEARFVPRDNVLFEVGLFVGRLGRLRTFLLEPRNAEVKLPSDLSGITTLNYEPGADSDLLRVLGPACNQLRRLINEIGPNN